jgi:hypothetical protein
MFTSREQVPLRVLKRPAGTGWRAGDRAATLLLLALLLVTGVALSIAVVLMQMNVAACSDLAMKCDFVTIGATTWITPVTSLAGIVLTTIALIQASRGKVSTTWWIPSSALAAIGVAFIVSISLLGRAIPL